LNCSCRREDKRYGPARVRGCGKLSPSISLSPSSSLCCSLRLCLTGFFLLAGFLLPSGLCAQSEYVDINQNGIGAGIVIDVGGGSFSGASLAAAYSSNGWESFPRDCPISPFRNIRGRSGSVSPS